MSTIHEKTVTLENIEQGIAQNDILGSNLAAERNKIRKIMDSKIENKECHETERRLHNALLIREIEADRARMQGVMDKRHFLGNE